MLGLKALLNKNLFSFIPLYLNKLSYLYLLRHFFVPDFLIHRDMWAVTNTHKNSNLYLIRNYLKALKAKMTVVGKENIYSQISFCVCDLLYHECLEIFLESSGPCLHANRKRLTTWTVALCCYSTYLCSLKNSRNNHSVGLRWWQEL